MIFKTAQHFFRFSTRVLGFFHCFQMYIRKRRRSHPSQFSIVLFIIAIPKYKLVPCSYWTSTCCGALSPICALYAVPVRQARGLPPPSFRFRVATDTLGLSYALPATGRARDFHPLDCAHAGRTQRPNGHYPVHSVFLGGAKGIRTPDLLTASPFDCFFHRF